MNYVLIPGCHGFVFYRVDRLQGGFSLLFQGSRMFVQGCYMGVRGSKARNATLNSQSLRLGVKSSGLCGSEFQMFRVQPHSHLTTAGMLIPTANTWGE